MKTILFPTDFTSSASMALQWAKTFAAKYKATLVLLHVHQPPLPDTTLPTVGDLGVGVAAAYDLEQIGHQQLDHLAGQLRAEGLTIDTEWRMGGIEDEILSTARDRNADLIITGRHNMSTFFDWLAGSAATDVALDASCPVLVVPAPDEHESPKPVQVNEVIFATQLEFDERAILQQATQLTADFGGRLHFLKVNADNQPDVFDDEQFKQQLQRTLGSDPLRVNLIHARTVTGGLSDYLTKHEADILVMTTRERGFLDGLLNPSLTKRMVLQAHLPVLVYHSAKVETP
ncbi:universal stress protein [Arsenicibacter rosenii]|uniref:Universal stress protein UspA n=1 Tax=Arsenicibacter rosenii TaxID=1750698 RepID=A0A1S2VF54_9BACT|nr:universal stress protein [Arsenicibacter rosenii]OIN57342.1 universal stress protein UspA [Arsenicibacter rosenii]